MLRLASFVLSALVFAQAASAKSTAARSLTVYHRFVFSTASETTPSAFSETDWVERGHIEVADGEVVASFVSSVEGWKGLAAPLRASEWAGNDKQIGEERYQIAVRDKEDSVDEMSFISVDPCILYTSGPSAVFEEHFTLSWSPSSSSFSSSPSNSFTGAVDYRTSTSVNSPACNLKSSAKERSKFEFAPLKQKAGEEKVVVKLQRPLAIQPEAPVQAAKPKEQQPVQVDKDGKILPPPKEKSFIQKYWMYIVPALLIIMIGGGEPPAEEGKGGGGGAKK
ncbi:hypothetical protein JCM8547_006560 [Rhodosporidiobolus lusitaniae]